MKKRLLITSIVMMLVVAVALSTATYAWFTTSQNVTADAVVLTAATMEGDAILITHEADGSEATSSITLRAMSSSQLYPATPLDADGFDDGVAAGDFQSLIMTGTGTLTDPGVAAPNVKFYSDTFYIFNYGFQPTTLVPTVHINYDPLNNTSAMAAKSVRVAILERVPVAEVAEGVSIAADNNMTTYSLKGIWAFDDYKAVATNAEYDEDTTYYTRSGAAGSYIYTEATIANAAAFDPSETAYYVISTDLAAPVYEAATGYVAGTTYYTRSGSEPAYTYAKIAIADAEAYTAATTGENAGQVLYVSVKQANLALKGAVSTYGATDDNEDGAFDQGSETFTENGFSAIGAASSNHQIANEYTVVVWLEGWDADCTNQITSGVFSVDLSFAAGR